MDKAEEPPPPEPTASHDQSPRGGKALVRVLTGLACLLTGYGVWVQFCRDEEPSLLEEPAVLESKMPDERNGLRFLTDVIRDLELPYYPKGGQSEILYKGEPWDAEVMNPLLESAEALRMSVGEALKMPHWWKDEENFVTPSSVRLRMTADIFRTKAMELAENGRMREAVEWLSKAHELNVRCFLQNKNLADHMQMASGLRGIRQTLMRLVGAYPPDRHTVEEALRMTVSPVIDFGELRAALRLTAWDWIGNMPSNEMDAKGEWPVVVELRKMCSTKAPDWLIRSRYKPQATRNLLISYYGQLAENGFREGADARRAMAHFKALIGQELKEPVPSFAPNRAGRILAAGIIQYHLNLGQDYFMVQEAERRCQAVALAARLHTMDHGGRRPDFLGELVPRYLEKVPLDPYDGQPVRWVPATGMAYVSGNDGHADIPIINPRPNHFSSPDPEGAWAQLP